MADLPLMTGIDRSRLDALMLSETERFVRTHPKSGAHATTTSTLLAGVPMPWMRRWPGPFPVVFDAASGARFTDIDGNEYVDLCLGDTGAMTGHAHREINAAITAQLARGSTAMLPTPDAAWVADELTRRFGLPKWQFAISATDANRFLLRFARAITGKPKVLVHDWCYHGTVDETLVIAMGDRTISRGGAIGPQINPELTTRVVPFNDLAALERAASCGDVACMLIEPALTNIGIVLPEPGYLEGVREITRRHGILLIIDETHTICAGAGGCTEAWNLEPDMLVIGKTIGGGLPVGAYGMSSDVATLVEALQLNEGIDVSGVGGTLAGNALAMAAVRATLTHALLAEQFIHKQHALFLGRGEMSAVAAEGALKLKEISYIHAEAYAAGELKHGPLALVDEHMPVVAVAPNSHLLEKVKSNLQEVKARGGALYVFADREAGLKDEPGVTIIPMPHGNELTNPLLYTVPLQLLAYHVACLKGTDVDQPRNLAKSVTVE